MNDGIRCPYGYDVGDPPHAINCPFAPRPCPCGIDCLAYEAQPPDQSAFTTWRWWADVRGEP